MCWPACGDFTRIGGYGKKFKMAELNDSPCSSDHEKYSDPLEIAASAGAWLSTPEKAGIFQKKRNVRGSVNPNRGIDLRSSTISVLL